MRDTAVRIADWNALEDRAPARARVGKVDLVVIRLGEEVSVLYGRCAHRNALLADGHVEGDTLVCAQHGWDYHCRTGRSLIDDEETLESFEAWIEEGGVWIDGEAVRRWRACTPRDFLEGELDG